MKAYPNQDLDSSQLLMTCNELFCDEFGPRFSKPMIAVDF